MTVAASAGGGRGPAHAPEAGMAVWLEGVPEGPWRTSVARADAHGVVVDAPRLAGEPVPLTPGTACLLAYMLREVPCEVPVSVAARDVAGWALRYEGPVVRLQRRDSVRVPVRLLTRALVPGEAPDGAPLAAVTENLSAGGALLRTADGLPAGTAVRLALSVGGDAGELALAATVLRSDRLGAGSRPFRVAVTFADLPRRVEDRIVRFLFARQRELRRLEGERP